MGPTNAPRKRTGARYIITTTDYLTRWVEATPIVDCTTVTESIFLFENIVMWFGCPRILMSDQVNHFIKHIVNALTEELKI